VCVHKISLVAEVTGFEPAGAGCCRGGVQGRRRAEVWEMGIIL